LRADPCTDISVDAQKRQATAVAVACLFASEADLLGLSTLGGANDRLADRHSPCPKAVAQKRSPNQELLRRQRLDPDNTCRNRCISNIQDFRPFAGCYTTKKGRFSSSPEKNSKNVIMIGNKAHPGVLPSCPYFILTNDFPLSIIVQENS